MQNNERQSLQSAVVRRWLAMLLLVLASSGVMAQTSPPKSDDGYYQIATIDELKWFRDYVNDKDAYANARLVADIDMEDKEFWPIGDYGHKDTKIFRGTFDGDGHVLSNFFIKRYSDYIGLVGYANGATIKNVTIQRAYTRGNPNYEYAGAILGFGTNHTNVINCHVLDGDIHYNVDHDGDYHGGIAGKIDVGSHIEGCTFHGKVGGDDYVGGIVGEVNSGAKVYNSILKDYSEVYGDDYIGGIGGIVYDKETRIENCFVQPTTYIHSCSSTKYIGTLAGYTEYAPTNDAYDVRGLYYSLTGKTTTSDNGSTTCYDTEVTGTVSGYTDNDYVVCTDMGVTYSYFNRRICAKALNQVSNLKTFSFIDYNHNTGAQRAYRWIDMAIADQAFYYCHNFQSLYMKYKMGGVNGFYVMLDPTDVYPEGDKAFEGCDNMKIYVDAEKYDAFLADSRWSKYKDRIVSTTDMRKGEFNMEGVQYARDNKKNSKGEYQTETGSGDKTVYDVHVIGGGNLIDTKGYARIYNDIGQTYAYRTTRIWNESFRGNEDLRAVVFRGAYSGKTYMPLKLTIGKRAFADCPQLKNVDIVYANTGTETYEPIDPDDVYPDDDTMLEGSENAVIRVWPDLVAKFRANAHWRAYADRIVAWTNGGTPFKEEGVIYEPYILDKTSKKLEPDRVQQYFNDSEMKAILKDTKNDFASLDVDYVVQYSVSGELYAHIVGADNDVLRRNGGTARIYTYLAINSGAVKTKSSPLSIDSKAFCNNKYLRHIEFSENTYKKKRSAWVIQKNALYGCPNLESIDLIYYYNSTTDRVRYLEPKELVPAKDIFGDGNTWTKIRVNPEKIDEFKADPNWSQYADRIEPYYVNTGKTHDEKGLTYMESGMKYDSPDDVRCFETYVTGVADGSQQDFTIYTDIGETYAYRNVFIKRGAFKKKNSLRSIKFSDAIGGSAHFWIKMLIDDSTFVDCPNFEAIYMKYEVTGGVDHTIMLDPDDVYPRGDNAFINCPKLKIYVDADKYEAFVNHQYWGKYKDLIVPTTDMRHCDFAVGGALYARDHNQDGEGTYITEKSPDNVNVYSVHVNGPDGNLMSSYSGVATIYNDPGTTYAYRTTKIWAEAYKGCADVKRVRFIGANSGSSHMPFNLTIGSRAFADCPNLSCIDVVYGNSNTKNYEAITPSQVYPVDTTMLQGSAHTLIRVWPDQVEAFKADAHWKHYADRIVAWSNDGNVYSSDEGLIYTSYIHPDTNNSLDPTELRNTKSGHDAKLKEYLEAHKSEFAAPESINWDDFVASDSYGNVYYTHVTGVNTTQLKDNNGHATLWNDIGSYYNYRTVSIDKGALRGCKQLRRLDFGDIPTAGKTDVPLKVLIEEGAFKGCDNFGCLDLVYRRYTGTNTIKYLDPSQVIPAKNLFDDPSRVVIRVGKDKVDAFKADPNWKQYADRIYPYETSLDTYDENGLKYAVMVDGDDNRRVIKGDNGQEMYETAVVDCNSLSKPTDYNVLVNIGSNRHYFTNAIKTGAFNHEESLRSIYFKDVKNMNGADKWIDIKIEDNAFMYCKNFEALYMKYELGRTNDMMDYNYEMLGPTDVYPVGKDAFAGCDNLKVYVDPEKYQAFINDPHWAPYADRIVSTISIRQTESYFKDVAGGARYNLRKNKDADASSITDDIKGYDSPVYQVVVSYPDKPTISKNKGVCNIYTLEYFTGDGYADRTMRILTEAFDGCEELTDVRWSGRVSPIGINMTIGSRAFAHCSNLRNIDMVYKVSGSNEYKAFEPTEIVPDDATMLEGSGLALIRVWPSLIDKYKADPHWAPYADRIIPWESYEHDGDETLTITTDEAGTLADKLGLTLTNSKMNVKSGDCSKYKKLKVSGKLNPIDLNTLAILAGQKRNDSGTSTTETSEWSSAKSKGLDTDEFFHTATDIVLGSTPSSSKLWYIDLSEATFVNLDGTARTDFVLPRRTFKDCDVLETIVLPRTLRKLTVEALAHADKLKHVVLGDQTTVIEENALANCPSLETVTALCDDINLAGGNQISGSTSSSPVASGEKIATLYCAENDHEPLAANASVQKYCANVVVAFNDKGLMKVMASCDILCEDELYKLSSLGQMLKGNNEIEDLTALSRCTRLTTLDDYAFAAMYSLKRIAMPANIETIGKYLFVDNNDQLRYIDWRNGKASFFDNIDHYDWSSPFKGVPRRALIYAPVAAADENVVSTLADGAWHTASFWRDDYMAVEIPYAFTTDHAEIGREFQADIKSTIYLPFAIDEANATALGRFYEFAGYDSTTGSVNFRRIAATEAGKAYLFLPATTTVAADASTGTAIDVCATTAQTTADSSTDGMYGTWERKTWTEATGDDYGYADASQGGIATSGSNVSTGQFVRIEAGAWAAPMRAWLHLNHGASVAPQCLALLIDDNRPTGIVNIDSDNQPSMVDVYTLDGKMVRHSVDATECLKGLPEGIYVVNGKKVYCK